MRTTKDRIRHLVLFEVTALLILVPIGAVFFGFDPFEIGALGASTAAIAAVWNYVYNLGFDRILKRLTGSVHKRMRVRVLHALLFEGGLVVMLVPLIAWWLDISLWRRWWPTSHWWCSTWCLPSSTTWPTTTSSRSRKGR